MRDRTDRAWFSRLLRHPARKWSGSILTTPEPARDNYNKEMCIRDSCTDQASQVLRPAANFGCW